MTERQVFRARDGFIGHVIGEYETREGVPGLVLQQIGTTVVHVYRETSVVLVDARALDQHLCWTCGGSMPLKL